MAQGSYLPPSQHNPAHPGNAPGTPYPDDGITTHTLHKYHQVVVFFLQGVPLLCLSVAIHHPGPTRPLRTAHKKGLSALTRSWLHGYLFPMLYECCITCRRGRGMWRRCLSHYTFLRNLQMTFSCILYIYIYDLNVSGGEAMYCCYLS